LSSGIKKLYNVEFIEFLIKFSWSSRKKQRYRRCDCCEIERRVIDQITFCGGIMIWWIDSTRLKEPEESVRA
jgi:hypothetical protein